MNARVGLRAFQQTTTRASFRPAVRRPFQQPLGRRYAATDATVAAPEGNLLTRLWNSPVGMKTVHFW